VAVTTNQPIAKAPRESRVRLGQLLFRRREELGFGDSRPRFYRATGVNRRYADDLENARRSNFDEPFLRMAARGYAVAYQSVIDVAWGKADKLTPADDKTPAAGPLPAAPMDDAVRTAADRPYADRIWAELRAWAAKGVTDPSGAQLFGAGTQDAEAWDGTAGRMDEGDRVWHIADLQRFGDRDRNPNSRAASGNSA